MVIAAAYFTHNAQLSSVGIVKGFRRRPYLATPMIKIHKVAGTAIPTAISLQLRPHDVLALCCELFS
jgi:hypothetical protein